MSYKNPPTAVIIGGTKGIGLALAKKLSAQGWRLIVAARDTSRSEDVAKEINGRVLALNAQDATAVNELFETAVGELGHVHAAVNCAGGFILKPAHLTTDEDFAAMLGQNLNTAFNVVRAASRIMMKQTGGGSVVLCSSVAARRGFANHEAIAAAKAGVEGLALAAAATYARWGVRFNCVAPGLTRTDMTRSLIQNEQTAKISAAMHPLGRIGEPEDVAAAIAWLMDPAQSWITGQVIGVDGGFSTVQARS